MRRARWPALIAGGLACSALAGSPAEASPTLAAAGDIACPPGASTSNPSACQYGATATLIQALAPDAVASLGDTQYEDGTTAEFTAFDSTWGQFKPLIRPAIGNHEYLTAGAAGYFGYFGAAAGDPAKGYYSYDLGSWHLVALNSDCDEIDCAAETQWLRADLADHPSACTLAYWHHPLFTSGPTAGQANNLASKQFWQVLYDSRADVILNGHDHDYERFAPQTPEGAADNSRGVREFVAGTGGDNFYTFESTFAANSEQHYSGFGVLLLTLDNGSYTWSFHPTTGSFSDTGSGVCDDRTPVAGFSYSPPAPVVGQALNFDGGRSSDPDSRIASYAWDFGDGTSATGATATHAYAAPGTYPVRLTVTDDGGRTDSATLSVTVAAPAAPEFPAGRPPSPHPTVTLTLRVPHRSLGAALRRGLRVVLSSSAAGRLTLVVRGSRRVVLGRRSTSLTGTGPVAMIVRLSARRALRLVSRGRLRLTVQARLSVAGTGHAVAARSLLLRG